MLLFPLLLALQPVVGHVVPGPAVHKASVPVDLSALLNNKAFGTRPGEAAFDSLNQSFPVPDFDTRAFVSSTTGVQYSFPGYSGPHGEPDNVICEGQTIAVHPGRYFSASFLVDGDVESNTVLGNVTFGFSDASTTQYELRTPNWFSFLTINRGEIIFPSRYTASGANYNTSHIYERTASLPAHKELVSITLPVADNSTTGRLHVFALSLWSGAQAGAVSVQDVRPTQKWDAAGHQIVEVTVNNAGAECVSGRGMTVALTAPGFVTVSPATVRRLCPGDQKTVALSIASTHKHKKQQQPVAVTASVVLEYGCKVVRQSFADVELGLLEAWTPDLDTLSKHESPDWFNDAKFGIFIHWGPYSATGWGNSSPYESYAEWFWWYSTHHPQADKSDFFDYRRNTYGEDWVYDDTFDNFTAASFDARAWVDLIADAGAKYFVLTTKHHDGFALFDSGNITHRSSMHYGPQRDLLGELFSAAETYQPGLKRGTYFSLPEWFNPDFGPYGFDQFDTDSTVSWPGVLATNPYTGAEEPYTGRIPVDDFVADVMVPQMDLLAYNYTTDLMWCDCGAANGTADFAARWWNQARADNRHVAINSRCGIPEAADFDTPEYQTFSVAQQRKWESNQGMDPYSYGYNRATPDSAYMNASTIVYSLVDMVSKNGNFLLDIGPRADGTIVDVEAKHLRDAGAWIQKHDEAIYNTTYWFVQSELLEGPDVRFTQTQDAFYVLFLEEPVPDAHGVVSVAAPLPVLPGDVVTLLGSGDAKPLPWTVKMVDGVSTFDVKVSAAALSSESYCWVFKIAYK